MGRRSHSDRNRLKHKKRAEKDPNDDDLEHSVNSIDAAIEKSSIRTVCKEVTSVDLESTLKYALTNLIHKPISQESNAHLYPTSTITTQNGPTRTLTLEHETTRTALKKEQRECLGYIKCIYSRRNVASITADDLTAADPMLNIIHILHHNCVPVPVHWRLRNGRFLSEHVPKYTVASKHQNVYQIPLFAAKLYNPKDVYARFQRSSKENKQCSTPQAIDITYEHRINWVTTPLLSHGDLYQEARSSIICRSTYSPGTMSDELREALNIQPNDPPPWLARQSLLPKPSWLQDISIAALNVSVPKQETPLLRF
ncbi:Hypothetical protein GLP15_4720 [Giardia lamblia P15]|uniref:PSP proline-rich domain-containing protein n=1 Tax=Giardia intestinalis (strain P15) TaxID=658858 RepID=E1F1N8_GIAIA|nr:Hypothetical protein GLP15_4720 [Giardia lamblia P15]